MGVSAAVNGGNLYTPYIVNSINNPTTGETLKLYEPVLKRRVISEESSKLVRYALESVVAQGTGRNAYINNYRVGGKTGTAQKVKDGKYIDGNYILSFVGFLPADDPEVVVYVAIDNPKGVVQYGGTVAAPVAKRVMQACIDILDIKESTSDLTRTYELWDTVYYEVPDVVGMDKITARKTIGNNLQVEYSGSGSKVISQSPESGEYVKQNGTIRLMLGE
jgi:stage V sporulation protein D (sporulation-specific penicillin-binding protein)